MPELPKELTPKGLLGWTERFGTLGDMYLSGVFPEEPNDAPANVVTWEIVELSRDVSGAVPYDAPGREVELTTREVKSATAPTFREQKRIKGSYIQWLRAPGATTRAQGMEAVDREIRDLLNRIERRQELLRSQCLKGQLSWTLNGASVTVDTELAATHTDPSSVDWSTSSNDIITDLEGWITLIEQDGGMTPDTLLVGRNASGYLINNDTISSLLSDSALDRLLSGRITRIPGLDLDIVTYNQGYVSGGTFYPYVGADEAIMYPSEAAGQLTSTVACHTNDGPAPESQRGVYVVSWMSDEPPRGARVSVEYTGLPIMRAPELVVYDSDVTS